LDKYHQILVKYWGYSSFRPLQEDIIKSAGEGNDTLGLMPTGGGKSLTFQVPALANEGICIVVTPLIALMKDQVENLKKRGVNAIAIFSGLSSHEIDIALNNCIYGNVKFLYLSPERLGTELFRTRVTHMKVNLIAVDESHCISQWGYDFRPSYLKIAEIRELLPDVPVIALTATATVDVVDDIQERLGFKEKNVFRKSFERKNLAYYVKEYEDKLKYLVKYIQKSRGSGVVYVRNRKRTKEIAQLLYQNKVSADFYHAGLSNEVRSRKQEKWKNNQIRVMVSTNAFGMGIDKPDVRFVVHIDLPDSLEAYFQEAGRAGRDEDNAYAILLYHESDKLKLQRRIDTTFPPIDEIKRIYEALCNYYSLAIGSGKDSVLDFNIRDFASTFKFDPLRVYSSLKILQREGYLELTDEIDNPSKVFFMVNKQELYKFQVANAKMDGFIKLLLRSYTGLFSEYVPVDEEFLARKANTNLEVIYKLLQALNNAKIIRYIPRKKTPLIVFTEERLDLKSVHISKENYQQRKDRFVKRINAVINYAESTAKCRSQILLSYFGETETTRCGQCDICQKRNELELSKYEFDLIHNELKTILRETPKSLVEVTDQIDYPEEKIIKVIQYLLDNHKIEYDDTHVIHWVKY
jgi:ATP-dependent DNA helicase RecQ